MLNEISLITFHVIFHKLQHGEKFLEQKVESF